MRSGLAMRKGYNEICWIARPDPIDPSIVSRERLITMANDLHNVQR